MSLFSGGKPPAHSDAQELQKRRTNSAPSHVEELRNLTSWLRMNGYENCCQMCGKLTQTASYYVSGFYPSSVRTAPRM